LIRGKAGSATPGSDAACPLERDDSLYIAHCNFCRVHEAHRSTPPVALGVAERVWTIGDLLDTALATQLISPTTTAPNRRKLFRVIDGGKDD
jgi:hypothetical protein